jgi:lipopolysaccharide/colanic/teichoic acid biosynthesis glycosyltransferase
VPGLTGLWQVDGKNKTTFREKVRLDIAYARSNSVTFDLEIMARTFGVLGLQIREVLSRPPVGPQLSPVCKH